MWRSTLETKRVKAGDGTGIAYQALGKGTRAVVLANGLGGRLYAWEPLIEALWPHYRIITWDYRGLFDSDSPPTHSDLRIPHHAHDAVAILDAEGIERAAFVGWSMGVLVSLELTALYAHRVEGLVLVNGIHGHALETGFQPLFRVPGVPKLLHAVIEGLIDRPELAAHLAKLTRAVEIPTTVLFSLTAGRRSRHLRPLMRQYYDDVLGPSFENFMRLFQELDAHSVYHVLRQVAAPTLVISGALDPLAPAYQSKEIARRIPGARHVSVPLGSHFCLVERPEVVVPQITRFLAEELRWAP